MTIANAFNEIAVAQGGTASTSGTIAGAIDALNDALAGSDQDAAATIEDAVRLLGQHISSGGGGATKHSITCKVDGEAVASMLTDDVTWSSQYNVWIGNGAAVSEALPGAVLGLLDEYSNYSITLATDSNNRYRSFEDSYLTMPDVDIIVTLESY